MEYGKLILAYAKYKVASNYQNNTYSIDTSTNVIMPQPGEESRQYFQLLQEAKEWLDNVIDEERKDPNYNRTLVRLINDARSNIIVERTAIIIKSRVNRQEK